MEFPITELMDDRACYELLLGVLPPKGVRCPAGHKVVRGQAPHMSGRAPLVDYRGRRGGKVFKLFTGTLGSGTHYSGRQVVVLVRGCAQGVPTVHLAQELKLDDETVRNRRYGGQAQALKKKLVGG